jgi:hypothetical protein
LPDSAHAKFPAVLTCLPLVELSVFRRIKYE